MSDVLTAPVMAAAALVCVAAVGKLRDPVGAVRALIVLGLPGRGWQVRALFVVELAVGVSVLAAPAARIPAAVLAGLYVAFAGAAALLRGRGSACGCFGGGEAPASAAHVLLSGALALICAAAAAWPPHRLGWTLARPVLALGVAGCVYAIVLTYTQLPNAWGAWRAR